MELTINIRLTADAALLAALQALASCCTTTGKPAPVPTFPDRPDMNQGLINDPQPVPTPVTDAPDAAPDAAPAPKPAEPAKAEPSMPTTLDVRSAMEAARARLEYPEGNGQRDEEIHRRLTATFKAIAAEIGGTKPSQLPEEQRLAFIDRVTRLDADDVKDDLPF